MKRIIVDKEEFYKLYIVENKSLEEVSKIMGISTRKLYAFKKENDIYKDSEQKSLLRKKTNIQRFGVENPYQSEEIKTKCKQTKLEKYGDENYNNRVLQKQTMMDKYGVACGYNLPEVQEKIRTKYGGMGFASEEIANSIKSTLQERYRSRLPNSK